MSDQLEIVRRPRKRVEHFTEADLLARVRDRYATRGGNGPRWVVGHHVRDNAGFNASRTLDAVVMDTWLSSGLALHGFEVKTSRADWRRELAQPEKSAAFLRYLDHFWIVAPSGVVDAGGLPLGWGLLEPHGGGLRAKVVAARLSPEPVPRSFYAALLRAVAHRTPTSTTSASGALPAPALDSLVGVPPEGET